MEPEKVLDKGGDIATVEEAVKPENTLPPHEPIDKAAESRLKWKIDLIILPMLCLTFFFSSMGKSNLSYAYVGGLELELNMTAKQYSAASNYFLVGFIVFQLPGTLLLRKIGPSRLVGTCCILWGVFTSLQVLVRSYAALAGLRTLIGICEGVGNGVVLYLSFWYTYDELATRAGIFWGSTALASSFTGLIAYGIGIHLNGKNGWLPWRWIFLIEGVMPVIFGFMLLIVLPSTPETAKFGFSQAEKDLAVKRSRRSHNPEAPQVRPMKVFAILLKPTFWLFTVQFCGFQFCSASILNFTPTIIKGLGYTSVHASLMASLVFAVAFVGVISFCRAADLTDKRAFTQVASLVPTIIGYVMLLASTNGKLRYGGVCLVAFGNFPGTVLILSWMTMSMAGYTARASTAAIMNMIGQSIAIAANFAFLDPPYYRKGIAASLAMTIVQIVAIILTWFYLKWRNHKKELAKDTAEATANRLVDLDIIGEDHPDFRSRL